MMKKNLLAVAVASLALSTMAHAAFKDMTVDGIAVSKTAQETLYNQAVQQGAPKGQKLESDIREQFVQQFALLAAARKSPVAKLPQVQQAIKAAQESVMDEILQRAYLDEQYKSYNPSESELQKLYADVKKQTPSTQYQYSVIATRTEKEAKAALARLSKREAFSKVAKAVSIDPTARNGGQLGFTFQQNLNPELQKLAKDLKKGHYTMKPVQVNGSWVILKLDNMRSTPIPGFDQLKARLVQVARQQHVRDLLANLANKAVVK